MINQAQLLGALQRVQMLHQAGRIDEAWRALLPLRAAIDDHGQGLRLFALVAQASGQLDPAADVVFADRVQIQQVLVNLIRNAVDAMAHSPRRELTITSRRLEDGAAEVSVSDTGPGVDEAFRERLFQPFMTTKAEGRGVGLSISRSIVEAHGGRIWAELNAQGGAVFRFTLPPAAEESLDV